MDKRISAGIFKLTPKGGSRTKPSDCFSAIEQVAEGDREIDILDADVRIHRLSYRRGVWSGEFMRRQSLNIPPKATARGRVVPLGLRRDEGLGHGACFLFFPANSILVWESVRTGASITRFRNYLEQYSGGASYEINPSLTREAMTKLRQARVKKLRIKIAEPDRLRAFDNTQRSLKDAMRLLERLTNGAYVEIAVGSERGAGNFLSRGARDAMRWLLSESLEDRGGILKLQIDGRAHADEATMLIDLLHDRMKSTKVLDIDGADLDANFERRIVFLRSVYGDFEDDINALYGDEDEADVDPEE